MRLHSVNRTWPDTTATVHECIEGKIAWRATLAGNPSAVLRSRDLQAAGVSRFRFGKASSCA